ncbi:hypothetical protein ACFSSA_05655 [Luteolibacter algae]|uniref:Uncharacterized protein n=1 Tax=Luteolibacter algae TaxID=454151 RepID=A0ABW5D5M3_9BACT
MMMRKLIFLSLMWALGSGPLSAQAHKHDASKTEEISCQLGQFQIVAE